MDGDRAAGVTLPGRASQSHYKAGSEHAVRAHKFQQIYTLTEAGRWARRLAL